MARGHSVLAVWLFAACACGRTEVRAGFDANGDETFAVRPERIVFPPTLVGETSRMEIEIVNRGSTQRVGLFAPPPFAVQTSVNVPGRGTARVPIGFTPFEVGPVATMLGVGEAWGEGLATLEGEGLSRCVSGCNDGNACTIDLCADPQGCFHEAVICPPAQSACELSECHPALGCRTVAMPDGTVCGTTACGGARVCRAGQCAESGSPVRLVGHWTFDEPEGTTIVDTSGLGHHGVLVAGARVPSRRNRGITHTDGALLVDVPDHPDFAFSGSFTVEVWIETPDLIEAGQQVIVFRGDVREGLDPLVFSMQPYGARFLVEGPFDGIIVDPSAPVLARAPVQLTGVFDAEALEARLYRECALVAAKCSEFSSPISELDATSEPGVGLGGHARRGGTIYSFRGVLDEVRMYEGAMTPAEVASSCAQ